MIEQIYKAYLKNIYRNNGLPLSAESVGRYSGRAIRVFEGYLKELGFQEKNVFEFTSISGLMEFKTKLDKYIPYLEKNSAGHRMYSAALNHYIEFAMGEYMDQCTFEEEESLDIKEEKWFFSEKYGMRGRTD